VVGANRVDNAPQLSDHRNILSESVAFRRAAAGVLHNGVAGRESTRFPMMGVRNGNRQSIGRV
jgi:hypothetical protein